MSSKLRTIGAIFLLCATIMSLLVSLSITIPHLPSTRFAQTDFAAINGSAILSIANATGTSEISEIRYGVWSACYSKINDTDFTCLPKALGYTFTIQLNNGSQITNATVSKALTRPLVIHPLATVTTFIAIPFSIAKCTNIPGMVLSIISLLVDATALGIDIAFLQDLKANMATLGVGSNTTIKPGVGMWIVALAFVLLANLCLWGSLRVERNGRFKLAQRLARLATE